MSKTKIITDSNCQEMLEKSTYPLLIDFYATWCNLCKIVASIIDDIADKYDGKATICKCNVDENPQLVSTYGIRGVPTILLFKNKQFCVRLSDAFKMEEYLEKEIQANE